MEVDDDEHSFYVEWRIENFFCWNKYVHSPAISTEKLRIGELIFDVSIFPQGITGDEGSIVLKMYDDFASQGEVHILSADRSRIYDVLIIPPMRVLGTVFTRARIGLHDLLGTLKDSEHEDALILEYYGKCRRPFYRFQSVKLNTKINAFDVRFTISRNAILESVSTYKILGDFTILDEEFDLLAHFQLFSFSHRLRNMVVLELILDPEQGVEGILTHSYIYLLRNRRFAFLNSETHIFVSDHAYHFFAILENYNLKGSTVKVRLKLVSDVEVYTEGILL